MNLQKYVHLWLSPGFRQLERSTPNLEVGIVDVLEYKRWSSWYGIFHNIKQRNDVCPTTQILQNLYFSLDLLLFYRLKAGHKLVHNDDSQWSTVENRPPTNTARIPWENNQPETKCSKFCTSLNVSKYFNCVAGNLEPRSPGIARPG